MLSTWLDDTQTWAEPASLSCFQHAISLEWISQVLDSTNKASVSKAVYSVLALNLADKITYG